MLRQENLRLLHEQNQMKEKIADNAQKVKQNKVLPYLVGNVVEVGAVWMGRTCFVLQNSNFCYLFAAAGRGK